MLRPRLTFDASAGSTVENEGRNEQLERNTNDATRLSFTEIWWCRIEINDRTKKHFLLTLNFTIEHVRKKNTHKINENRNLYMYKKRTNVWRIQCGNFF